MRRSHTASLILGLWAVLQIGGVHAIDLQPLEEIRQAAIEAAGQRLVADSDSTIEAGHLDARLRLQRCRHPLSASPLGRRSNGSNVTMIVRCKGDKPWKVYVPVSIRTYLTVAVASRPLARGIPLAKDDIRFEKQEISRLSGGYFRQADEILQRAPRRALPPGAVISPRDLDSQTLIRKGTRVSILAETMGISVRMPGRALEDAGKGEQVRVENLSSQRTITGVAVASGVVKVTM